MRNKLKNLKAGKNKKEGPMIKIITPEMGKNEVVSILEGLTGTLDNAIYDLDISSLKKIIDTIAYYEEK